MSKFELIAMMGILAALYAPSMSAQSDEPLLTEQKMEALVANIEEMYYTAQKALQTYPSDRLDPKLILETQEFDADLIIKWVREQTRWVPYQGVLRGARGVMLDRTGNTLDRSLLLHTLLLAAGFDARLVRSQLSTADVQRLRGTMLLEKIPPLDTENLPTKRGKAVARKATKQAADLGTLLALSKTEETAVDLAGMRDHWWVEFKDGQEWQTADIHLPSDGSVPQPKASSYFQADDLPDELFHKVTIRVVVEQFDKGQLREAIPLEHSFRAANGTSQHLELFYVPYGFENPDENASDEDRIATIAQTAQDWLPVLRTRDDQISQSGFSQYGQLERNPAKPAVQRKFDSSASALQNLGHSAPANDSILSAMRIEYQLDVPGQEPFIVKREIFDLIGPDGRINESLGTFSLTDKSRLSRGLALFTQTRILAISSDLPLDALEHAELDLWARHGHQIAALVRLMHDPSVEEPLERLASQTLPLLDLMQLLNARKEFFRFRKNSYLGTPNIVTTHDYLTSDDQLDSVVAVDIVFNQIGVVASGGDDARIRLEQGVLDTLLESNLTSGSSRSHNTAVLFESRGTTPWKLQEQGSPLSKQRPEAWARMRAAMESGYAVVAPDSYDADTEPAWWEIDADSGMTLGIGKNGWGVVATEDTIQRGGTSVGLKEVTKKQGIKVGCRIVQAAGYIEAAVDVVEPEPWFAEQDRKLHAWRMNQKWRAKHLRTIADLDRLMEQQCK
ncbi:MAG: hypothetical protein ACSLE2_00840 [Lysobacterales bacterium]